MTLTQQEINRYNNWMKGLWKDINSKKLNLFIRNSTSQPVEVIKITVGGKVLNASQIFQQNPELSYYQILTDKFILQPLMIKLEILEMKVELFI